MRKFWESKQAAFGEAFVLLAIGGLAAYLKPAIGVPVLLGLLAFGIYLIWRSYNRNPHESTKDDGLTLLKLLDEDYQRLKEITRLAIHKLRAQNWRGIEQASVELMSLSGVEIGTAIQRILLENVFKFMNGQPMTYYRDANRLAKQVKESALFTQNPENIAKDASVILREKIPYLKDKMEHDRQYKRLERQIARERDKFPSDAVRDAIGQYLDHSIKINAAWVMSEHDLDQMPTIERMVGRHLPMQFKVILMGLPGRMDEEMTKYRNDVAKTILEYLKESA